jgi:hypothetical protein
MALYLVSTWKPGNWREVISYDKAAHTMVSRNQDGEVLTDTNFHIDIVKRCGIILTDVKPKGE